MVPELNHGTSYITIILLLMKLKSDNRSVIQSNYNLTSTNFAIRAEDSPIIMEMMRSKIYSNKPAAVVREYTTNALDEHKLHNISRPVELHAPTAQNPEFTVRDFGKGLTDQEVREIYVNYGCSTKRNTDDLTGGLGIGCKAGFAYGSQFSIISITKDGQGNTHKNAYMAIIDESNTGTLKHIESTIDNTLDTGVQIGVGIDTNDIQAFGKEIWNLWLTCISKPTILNPNALGPIDTIEETIEILEDKTYYRTYKRTDKFNSHNKYTSAVAVMGNIGYPINTYHLNGLTHTEKSLLSDSNLHIKFDISELNIASNREELEYNKETIDNLESRIKTIFSQVTQNIVDKITPIKCWMERQHEYAIQRKNINRYIIDYIDKKLSQDTTGIYTDHNLDNFIMYQYKVHGGVNRLFAESSDTKHYCRISVSPGTRWIKYLKFFIAPVNTPKAQITRRLKSFLETVPEKEESKIYVLFSKPNESKDDVLTRYKLPYISDKYVLNVLDYEPLPANIVARSSNSKSHVDLFSYNPRGYTDTDTWTDAGSVSLSSSSCVLFTYLSSVHAIKPSGLNTKSPHTNPDYRVDRDLFANCIHAFNSVIEHLTDQERNQLSDYLPNDQTALDNTHQIYGVRKNNWNVMKENPNAINIFELTSQLLQRAVDKEHASGTLLSDVFQLRTCMNKVHTLNPDDDSHYYRDPKFSRPTQDDYNYYGRRTTNVYKSFYKLYDSNECVSAVGKAILLAKTKKRKLLLSKLCQFARANRNNSSIKHLINNCRLFHNTKCLINNNDKNRLKPDEFLTIIKSLESELPMLEACFNHIIDIENRDLSDQEKCVYQILDDRSSDSDYDDLCKNHKQKLIDQLKESVVKYMIK